jgi:putative FmdB family regulatory protein
MPTYDYECTGCGYEFCVEQSMKDKPLKECSKCGGRLRKLLPRSLNLIFKGSGFYVTDYARGNPPEEPAEKPADTDNEGS